MSALALACASTLACAQPLKIEHMDPPFWWVGMQQTQLQLMVHGQDIGSSEPELNYPGVRIERVIPGGSVFGVRDAQGDWSFYLQRIATVEYWNVEKRMFGRRKLVGVDGGTQSPIRVLTPMEVVKFFPGPGEVSLKPYTNVVGTV